MNVVDSSRGERFWRHLVVYLCCRAPDITIHREESPRWQIKRIRFETNHPKDGAARSESDNLLNNILSGVKAGRGGVEFPETNPKVFECLWSRFQGGEQVHRCGGGVKLEWRQRGSLLTRLDRSRGCCGFYVIIILIISILLMISPVLRRDLGENWEIDVGSKDCLTIFGVSGGLRNVW